MEHHSFIQRDGDCSQDGDDRDDDHQFEQRKAAALTNLYIWIHLELSLPIWCTRQKHSLRPRKLPLDHPERSAIPTLWSSSSGPSECAAATSTFYRRFRPVVRLRPAHPA